MRMIGKTSETLRGLPSWAMAHLCYLVLRTRKENSSASGWYHCTTTKGAVRTRKTSWKSKRGRTGLKRPALTSNRSRGAALTKNGLWYSFAEKGSRGQNMKEFERIFWIVLDSVGIGELPDAADYGDVGRNTLGHIAESRPLEIPTMVRLGLANIAPLKHQTPAIAPLGAYGKGGTRSPGKDTTAGHWEMAGKWLDGPHRVGRVIARPFTGTLGNFVRTSRRHDYAVDPPRPMLMDVLAEQKVGVFGVGKIHDIYNGRGVEEYVTTKGNADGMEKLTAAVREGKGGLIFCNLEDFDMLYGHA